MFGPSLITHCPRIDLPPQRGLKKYNYNDYDDDDGNDNDDECGKSTPIIMIMMIIMIKNESAPHILIFIFLPIRIVGFTFFTVSNKVRPSRPEDKSTLKCAMCNVPGVFQGL